MHGRFTSFKGAVAAEVDRRSWFRSRGAIPLVLAVIVFALAGALLVYLGVRDWRPVYPRYSDVLLVGVGACLIANAALCLGTLVFNRRAWRRRTRRRTGGGRALGGVPPLSHRLPTPAGGAARDARALGALSRLRHRLRDRRARAAGRAAPHARSARRVERDLLDLSARRSRVGCVEPLDRRSRIGLRRCARASELRGGWRRRRVLRRWWRRRRRWWRRLRLGRTRPEEPSGVARLNVAP